MSTKLIAVRVPHDLYDRFAESCSDQGLTVSEALRQQIEARLTEGPPVAPAAVDSPPEAQNQPESGKLTALLALLTERLQCLDDLKQGQFQIAQRQEQLEEVLDDLVDQMEDPEGDEGEPAAPEGEEEPSGEEPQSVAKEPELPWPFSELYEKDDSAQ